MKTNEIQFEECKEGDIYQIDPDYDEIFGACLMVVTEIKPWGGAQGYFLIPGEDGGLAFYRCKFEHMVKVGHAEWIRDSSKDEEE